MSVQHEIYATVPLGMAGLLRDELAELGAEALRPTRAGVAFRGNLETAYRACLWSRLASRVLLKVGKFPAPDADALYAGVRQIPWQDHLGPDDTLAVHATGRNAALRHTGFAARRVKDGIVDQFRDAFGRRPSVDLRAPDLAIHLHLQGTWAELSLDLAGSALSRRGYRVQGGAAPLKENLAAAVLLLLDWPAVVDAGGDFVDPMCGSGTLPIEAAWMAADRAPGLDRKRFGFHGWRGHDNSVWLRLLTEAEGRFEAGLHRKPTIVGYDADRTAVSAAQQAVAAAGMSGRVHVERRELSGAEPPAQSDTGLVAVNPPYGERLGEVGELRLLYRSLGALVADRFAGWRVGVLTGSEQLAGSLGLEPAGRDTLYNGALECELLRFELGGGPAPAGDVGGGGAVEDAGEEAPKEPDAAPMVTGEAPGPGADAFAGRLRKRARHLAKWARRNDVSCYRLYDADLLDYAAAIDRYEDFVHVQEYAPPKTVDPARSAQRLADILALTPEVLDVPAANVFLKVRTRQRGRAQYVKLGAGGDFHPVREGGHRFLVNFTDYLDTGLFLDHRLVRRLVGELARGRRVLNLFGYTGTAAVYAAKGGATKTTTVDLSNTYLGWARRNLSLNGLDEHRNELVRADVIAWLGEQQQRRWDLIFLDPPTFSNSKRLDRTFDVQRDHVELIELAVRRLAPDGMLIFSNNYRKFELDREALRGLAVEDRTRQTIDEDFRRSQRIHHCYLINRS
jgi:23S rRNA (guanine2069-N7)-methyltransferase / 23S rRNA (guanine2445-N2)-methyltransferase